MRTLQARAVSSAAEPVMRSCFAGSLHSVFRHAANIVTGAGLWTIADVSLGCLPNAASVELTQGQWFSDWLNPGMQVRGDGDRLEMRTAGLRIDLSHATTIEARRQLPGPLLTRANWMSNLEAALLTGQALAPDEGLAPLWHAVWDVMLGAPGGDERWSPLCKIGYRYLCEVVHGIRANDQSLVTSGAQHLAGLGLGLTPSGDDVLIGLAGAISVVLGRQAPDGFLDTALMNLERAVQGRTNDIARTSLQHAIRGEVSNVLGDYIISVATGPARSVDLASYALFRVGATSGAELALGSLLGLWLQWELCA